MSDDSSNSIAHELNDLHMLGKFTKSIMDSVSSIYLLLDSGGNVVYCSKSALALWNAKDKYEVIGKHLYSVFDVLMGKSFVEREKTRFERLISGADRVVEDDVVELKTNGKHIYRITYERVLDDDGAFEGIIITLHDFTKYKFHEDERRMKEILHSTLLPCLLWDKDGNVVDCNKAALQIYGFPENLPSDYFHKLVAIQPGSQPDGRPTEELRQQFIKDALSIGYARIEVMLKRADGAPMIFDVTATRVAWHFDYRLFIYYYDLTDMRSKEFEAREAEKRVKIMLDSNPMMCFLRDENNNIIDCNQEALNIFGVSNKQELIDNYTNFYPEYQPDGSKSVEKVIGFADRVPENEKYRYEWTYQKADGELLPVETTLERIRWMDTDCYLSYSRDLREIRAKEELIRESDKLNRKLEIQREKAQAASEAKSQFLASMSHEIRTPMNVITGLLDLLRTDNLDFEQMKYLADIKKMSSVLLQIINDILDFHKIEAGKLELLPVTFNLPTLYDNIASLNQYLAESKHLRFIRSIDPSLPQLVRGDELRINQVVTNLISNAIKYTSEGFISFIVKRVVENSDEYISITVEDSGTGIREENFSTLFEEFEQFDSRKNRGIVGTGLGLAIAKRLTDMMGGKMIFSSEYGKGSVFTVIFPLVEGNPLEMEHETEIRHALAKDGTNVLVVDDNTANITVAVGILARHNIIPQTAASGVESIEKIKTTRFDLVFMDHMMPDMDGVEATKIIRELGGEYYSRLPIIALTANAVTGAKELFLSNGMNDFVSKPINLNELNRVLIKWLPPDKIEELDYEKKTMAPLRDEPELDKLLERLIRIKDLSVVSGLSRTGGDKRLYIDILKQFSNSANEQIVDLRNNATCGNWKAYSIKMHALKTVFSNIGNQFMSDWASSLENAVARGNSDKCLNETGYFLSAMEKFNTELKQLCLLSEATPVGGKNKISENELVEKLKDLLIACDGFDADSADVLAVELSNITLNDAVDASLMKIHDLVFTFDYDKAAAVTNSVIGML